MRSFIQPGDTLDLIAPAGGVLVDQGYLLGTLLAIATESKKENEIFAGMVQGVFLLPKLAADQMLAGQIVNWDNTNKRFQNGPISVDGLNGAAAVIKAAAVTEVFATVVLIPTSGVTSFSSPVVDNELVRFDKQTGRAVQGGTGVTLDDDKVIRHVEDICINGTSALSVKKELSYLGGTAFYDGGAITINAGDNTKIDVGLGSGIVIDNYTDPDVPVSVNTAWENVVGVTVTDLATADFSAVVSNSNGVISTRALPITREDLRDQIIIGSLIHASRTQVDAVNEVTVGVGQSPAITLIEMILAGLGPLNVVGTANTTKLSANGANLSINKSAGDILLPGANYKINKKDPNVITVPEAIGTNIVFSWQDGAGSFNSAVSNVVTPASFDDGTGGVGVPNGVVIPSNYTNYKIYGSGGGVLFAQYGQKVYANLAAAVIGVATEPFEKNPALAGAAFFGWVSVRGDASDLSNTAQAAFTQSGVVPGMTARV